MERWLWLKIRAILPPSPLQVTNEGYILTPTIFRLVFFDAVEDSRTNKAIQKRTKRIIEGQRQRFFQPCPSRPKKEF